MSSFALKIIAVTTMLIDHIGAIYFPQIFILRIIGRLAFPIFAFFISEGYRKTSDITDYIGRMLVFAFFSQIPFQLAFGSEAGLNVLFTFALALYGIYVYEKKGKPYMVFIIALAAQLLHTDYGAYGVLLVFIFYLFPDNFKAIVKYMIIITLLSSSQIFAFPALVLIYFYNGQRGSRIKYLFYIFYPGHLLFLYYFRELIIKVSIEGIL